MKLALKTLFPLALLAAAVQTLGVITMRDVFASSEIYCMQSTPDGSQWAGTANGLYVSSKGERFAGRPLPSLSQHPHPSVYALALDSLRSRLWIAGWDHVYCLDLLSKCFYNTTDLHVDMTVAMKTQPDGSVIADTHRGRFILALDSTNIGICKQINKTYYPKLIKEGEGQQLSRYDNTPYYIAIISALLLWLIAAVSGWLLLRHRQQVYSDTTTKRSQLPEPEDKNDQEEQSEEATHSLQEAESKETDTEFMAHLDQLIAGHLSDADFGIDQMAYGMALSRAQLFRKLKSAANTTPIAYLTKQRISAAHRLLQQTDSDAPVNLTTICQKVGFTDTNVFRRAYIKQYGKL